VPKRSVEARNRGEAGPGWLSKVLEEYISTGKCHPRTTEQAVEKMEDTNECRRNRQMVSDETIAVLMEKIRCSTQILSPCRTRLSA